MPAPTRPRFPRSVLLVLAPVALVLLAATGATAACTDYSSCCGAACRQENFRFAKALAEAYAPGYTATWTQENFCASVPILKCDAEGLHVSIDGKYSFMSSLPEFAVSGSASYSDLMIPSISLSGCTIPGSLPTSWGRITSLTSLSITNTGSMAATLPSEWAGLTKLRTLLLTATNVMGTIPASWGAMTSLQSVSLASTSVTGCLPTAWVCTASLTLESVGLAASSECPAKAALCSATSSRPAERSANAPRWAIGLIVTLGGLLLILIVVNIVVVVVRPVCLFGRRYDDWSGTSTERSSRKSSERSFETFSEGNAQVSRQRTPSCLVRL